jgi:hypothetical protein
MEIPTAEKIQERQDEDVWLFNSEEENNKEKDEENENRGGPRKLT